MLTVNEEPAICELSREVAAKLFRSALEQIVQETKHLRGIYMATLSFFFSKQYPALHQTFLNKD